MIEKINSDYLKKLSLNFDKKDLEIIKNELDNITLYKIFKDKEYLNDNNILIYYLSYGINIRKRLFTIFNFIGWNLKTCHIIYNFYKVNGIFNFKLFLDKIIYNLELDNKKYDVETFKRLSIKIICLYFYNLDNLYNYLINNNKNNLYKYIINKNNIKDNLKVETYHIKKCVGCKEWVNIYYSKYCLSSKKWYCENCYKINNLNNEITNKNIEKIKEYLNND